MFIYGKDTKGRKVLPIDRKDALPFILNIHYARRVPSISYAYGLFIDGKLVGCVTYGSPASPSICKGVAGEEHRKDVLELNRLVITDSSKNNASFLVGNSLKLLPKNKYIVSYADYEGWGHIGYVYQATNFLFTGLTNGHKDNFNNGKHNRHNGIDLNNRVMRNRKYRYIYITYSDKRKRKELMKALRYPVLEYPKGETRHYDLTNPKPYKELEVFSEKD